MTEKRFNYGVCIWNLPKTGPEACFQAAEFGLEGVELDMGSLEDGLPLTDTNLRQAYLAAADETGIVFPTLGANTLCDFGMSRKEKIEAVRQIFAAMVDTAVVMGIPKLQVPSFIDGFITNEDEFRTTVENLRILCDLAAEKGLIVGAENAISAEENLRLASEVDRSNLRFYFDTSNPYWFGGGMDSPGMIPLMSDRICEYHVKDQTDEGGDRFVRLGEGKSSFMESSQALMATDFRGWILLENDYREDLSLDDLRADIVTLRKVFG